MLLFKHDNLIAS